MCNILRATLVAGIALAAGCSQVNHDEVIPLDKIPEAAMQAAQKTLPDVKFETCYKGTYGGQEIFEIRGKNAAGKIREVEVTTTGEVVEIE